MFLNAQALAWRCMKGPHFAWLRKREDHGGSKRPRLRENPWLAQEQYGGGHWIRRGLGILCSRGLDHQKWFAESRARKRSIGGFGLQVFIWFVFFSAGPRWLLARIKNLDPTPKRPLTCLAYRRLVQERANTSHSSAPKGFCTFADETVVGPKIEACWKVMLPCSTKHQVF